MFTPTAEEAKVTFAAAKNLNAALKNLLKKESSSTPAVVAFAKEFRAAASSGKSASRDLFIDQNFADRQLFFLGAVRYAFPELIEATVSAIVAQYADEFNGTYERKDDGVRVINERRFAEIVRDVRAIIAKDLKASELPVNTFMESAMLATVFEFDVLGEVMKVIEREI